jgi:hypothetical protein
VLDCGCSINLFQLPTNPIKTHFGALSNRLPVQIANGAPSNPMNSANLWGSQSIIVAMIQKSRSKSVQRSGVSSVVVILVFHLSCERGHDHGKKKGLKGCQTDHVSVANDYDRLK